MAVEGRTLTLSAQATCDASVAVVRHIDQAALQAALDRAVREGRGLFIPAGRYRLTSGLQLRNATARIEGAHRDLTVLDIRDEHTAVFWISGGREVTIRALAMEGHTGFLELPANTHFPTATGFAYWHTANQQMEIKGCAAVNFVSTEHLLFEDLKVSRMASEAFYSHGSDRYGLPPYIQAPHEGRPELGRQYTKSCVYHRCHVSDCGFNAFNNNDHSKNTSILHSRVERATNFCENASRFSRIIGKTVIDGCATSVHGGGGLDPRRIGPTQAIIATTSSRPAGCPGASRSAIMPAGDDRQQSVRRVQQGVRDLPQRRAAPDRDRQPDRPDVHRGQPGPRALGICVETSDVLIADNQIYVRGGNCGKRHRHPHRRPCNPLHIHDNLIENCAFGLRSGMRVYQAEPAAGRFVYLHTESEVGEVLGPGEFIERSLPRTSDDPHPYVGWKLRWLTGANAGKTVQIAAYAQAQRRMTLGKPLAVAAGDRFAVFPSHANWQIHHNTIAGCTRALLLESHGSGNLQVEDNLISES